MKPRQIAAIVADPLSPEPGQRLERVLDFLGVAWESFTDASHLDRHQHKPHAILAPLTRAPEVMAADASRKFDSLFFYGVDGADCCEGLRVLTGDRAATFTTLGNRDIKVEVSRDWPELTGPMHGLVTNVRIRSGDRFAVTKSGIATTTILETEEGAAFFSCEGDGAPIFVSGSSHLPDLSAPVVGKGYDIRDEFLSAVPLLLYLKWAFRQSCWQAAETGACWIVDDPLLRENYGFCNFPLLETQMKRDRFATSVAMIPWNSHRTSPAMASLVRQSEGRLSVSIHGCDHTAQEFGTENLDALHEKAQTARQRMQQHRSATGVEHDDIMVFPQGVFSKASLRILQQHQFVAAVNTETLPIHSNGDVLTIGDVWRVAIVRYGSFPLFTRRYPSEGLENFAFDLLLGKPCLVVEHHGFFKGRHAEVVRFVDALNSLNGKLAWRSLGEVVRRSFLFRSDEEGVVRVQMFANELLLKNSEKTARQYRIEKSDAGSVGVREVKANGQPLAWETDGYLIVFTCVIASGAEVLLQVRYTPAEKRTQLSASPVVTMRIAARRYLSEFRDNFLSRHDRLLAITQRAKRLTGRAR